MKNVRKPLQHSVKSLRDHLLQKELGVMETSTKSVMENIGKLLTAPATVATATHYCPPNYGLSVDDCGGLVAGMDSEVAAVKVKGSRTRWIPMAKNRGQKWHCNVNLQHQPLSFEHLAAPSFAREAGLFPSASSTVVGVGLFPLLSSTSSFASLLSFPSFPSLHLCLLLVEEASSDEEASV
ncbi:hypothetical protein RIF29_11745 [Crotalaria pallida]|uniref:Expansin-like CBD domain-containing protein n=1 Tax=Crotalaria pallida TaxID=3830 RepID=A0AAN9IMH4_CROPI